MVKHLVDEGCMQEGGPWEIRIEYECSGWSGGEPCKHCHSKRNKFHIRLDGSQCVEPGWICPRAVIVYNEGGCNSTVVCLDCILEAVIALEL